MAFKLEIANRKDAAQVASLLSSAHHHLAERYGSGFWSSEVTEKAVLFFMRRATVFIVKEQEEIVATVTVSKTKPWALDRAYFQRSKRPVYVTAMAVKPELQGCGLGMECLNQVRNVIAVWPSDAMRLDAYDCEAGAGGFYEKCGFKEVGRVVYRGAPLIYFEKLL